jgi:hypothetical protein
VSTESLPNVLDPLLPFLHFSGDLSNPSDVLSAVGAFLSDAVDTIGQFSLSMYKFELKDGVRTVELNSFSQTFAAEKKSAKVRRKNVAENKV